MNTRIKIIKHGVDAEAETESQLNRDADSPDQQQNKTREMVNTVKSWIAELKDRKHIQPHSFSPLPVVRDLSS